MSMIVFACLLSVCVILGILNCICDYATDCKNISCKSIFIVSVLAFSLVNANLSSNYGAMTLMITLALSILLLYQIFRILSSQQDNTNVFSVISNCCLFVSCILFAFADVSLITFTPWGIVTGVCTALAFIMLVALIQKEQGFKTYALKFLVVLGPMIFFFQSLASLFLTNHVLVCSLIFISSAFMLAKTIIDVFSNKNNKVSRILQDIFFSLAIIVIAVAIFFL